MQRIRFGDSVHCGVMTDLTTHKVHDAEDGLSVCFKHVVKETPCIVDCAKQELHLTVGLVSQHGEFETGSYSRHDEIRESLSRLPKFHNSIRQSLTVINRCSGSIPSNRCPEKQARE